MVNPMVLPTYGLPVRYAADIFIIDMSAPIPAETYDGSNAVLVER